MHIFRKISYHSVLVEKLSAQFFWYILAEFRKSVQTMNYLNLLVVLNTFLMLSAEPNYINGIDVNKFTCHLSKSHWVLVKWYFDRCTYIEITQITLNKSHKSDLSNYIISGIMRGNWFSSNCFIKIKFFFSIRNSNIR